MICDILCSRFFFFQAEDGIRDLVRSRGLGDVYKRQGVLLQSEPAKDRQQLLETIIDNSMRGSEMLGDLMPVSYTHLTLPTSDLV